jgi:2-acylglycerol O-acyltransferase 1
MLSQWRRTHGIKGRFPFADSWRPGRFHLSPSLPELDWPMQIPRNVIGCGPILLPAKPVREQDPELDQWLSRAPTILFNLGTLFAISTENANAIARSLWSILQLDSQRKTQVLWKLQKHPDDEENVFAQAISILKPFIDEGRVRILSWLNAEPLALLQTGHVVCSIHHGGANSWFEAVQ